MGRSAVQPLVLSMCGVIIVTLTGCVTGTTPKGVPWTIRCVEIQGFNRARHIEQVADSLKRTPGIRAGQVFTTDDPDGFARLYYGRYYRRTNPEGGKRTLPSAMRRDLVLLRQLGDTSGQHYFVQAMPVRVPMPDVGDPDWDLKSVRGRYSLQVAFFEPTDDFAEYKQAAAAYCELLRGKGYEAYYCHGPASSVVTVGVYGSDAVITRMVGRKWRTHYSQEVLDLQSDELMKYNLLNGARYRARNAMGKKVPVPSRLVEIPQLLESQGQ